VTTNSHLHRFMAICISILQIAVVAGTDDHSLEIASLESRFAMSQ